MEKALHQLERDAERGEENIKKFLSGTAPSVPGFSSVRCTKYTRFSLDRKIERSKPILKPPTDEGLSFQAQISISNPSLPLPKQIPTIVKLPRPQSQPVQSYSLRPIP